MSFSSNGVTFNKTKWIRNRIFKFLFRGAEGILSVLFAISLAGPMIFPQQAYGAGVAKPLSYQGRLTDASGNPLGGTGTTYCMRFSVWDVATGGTANPNQLWPLSYATPYTKSITVTNGIFDTFIGSALGGDDDLSTFDFSSNDTTYLNIDVNQTATTCSGSWDSLSPRQRLGAVAYARVAADVYGVALRTSPTAVGIGAGSGQGNPIWLKLDSKNTPTTLGALCSTISATDGAVWYNSNGTRALSCVNNIIVALDNASEIAGIKEQSAGSSIASGVVNFSGSNNITINQNGSTLQFSVPTPVQGFGMSNIGNTLGTSGTGTGIIVLAGGNNITLSQATGAGARTVTIIGPAGGGAALQGSGTYSQNTGTVQFANSNGITFGLSNNGVMSASHNGLTVQSAQPVAISGSNGSFAFSTVSFGNLNGLSFYTTNGSIVGSYTAGAGGGAALQGSGTYSQNTGTVQFGNSNGITFGLSNNGVMTASHNGLTTAMASNAGSNFLAATGGFSGTNISGTILSNGLQLSVAAPGGGAVIPLNYYDNHVASGLLAGLAVTGLASRLFVMPLNGFYSGFPGDITANTFYLNLSQSGSTATMSVAFTSNFYLGIYTLNTGVSSLSLLNSVNASFAKNPAATNNSTAFAGPRFFPVYSSQWSSQPVFKGGSQYYLGWFWSSAGAVNQSVSLFGYSKFSTVQRSNMINTSGVATTQGWGPFYGSYSAATAVLPTAINNNQLNKVVAGAGFVPHVIMNASVQSNF